MKIVILIIIVILSLIFLFLFLAMLTKRKYSVARDVVINKTKDSVFEYIKLLKNQDNFSVWASMDPNMKKEYRGTDGNVGFISAWDSENKNVGKGEQEILKVIDGERVDYEIRFIKPFESTSIASIITETINESQTKVTWKFSSGMKYPMNIMLLFINMEKMIGNDFDKGLQRLRSILE